MQSIKAWFFVLLQFIVPKLLITKIIYRITRIEQNNFKNLLINKFINLFQINTQEVKKSIPADFASLNEFFIRELNSDARIISTSPKSIVSPADGKISALGNITKNQILQAKNYYYTLEELIGDPTSAIEEFYNGNFSTIYLAPYNYHRVHIPIDAKLIKMDYAPGNLFSVNEATASRIPKLFIRNERLICHFKAGNTKMIVIFVGALNVGSISTPWTGEINPRNNGKIVELNLNQTVPFTLKKGDLLGWFNMGSTVITLFSKDSCQWDHRLKHGHDIKMGDIIGSLNI